MTSTLWRAALVALAIVAIPTASISQMGYQQPAPDQRRDTSQPRPSTSSSSSSRAPKVRSELTKPLQEALKLQEAKDFAGAMAKLREADAAVADKTQEEEYVVAKFIGSIALKLNDVPTATAAFNRAVATTAMPDSEKAQMLFAAMALNVQAKAYDLAIQQGETLAALGPLDEKSSVALSQAYFFKGDYAKSLAIAQAALAKGVTDPTHKASLLEVQKVAQARMGDTSGAAASLEEQCAEVCDGRSWNQLVSIAMSKMAGISNHQALNLFRLQLAAGGMDADDYVTMATIALSLGLPAEAKSVLDRGIAAGKVTRGGRGADVLNRANSQVTGDARSLPQFEREASAKATGEEDVKLGETYYTHGKFAEAAVALKRGLAKPGVRDRADAQITLGIVLLAAGNKAEALEAFNSAASASSQKPIAHLWTLYANRKG